MTHDELIAEGAQKYRDALKAHLSSVPALALLIDTLDVALTRRGSLRAEEVVFGSDALTSVPDRSVLLNQWVPGLGSTSSTIISLGTEPAYSLHHEEGEDLTPICLETCAPHVLWLSGDPGGAISARILGVAPSGHAHHLRPTALLGVKSAMHTWGRLAAFVAHCKPLAPAVLRAGALFDHAYQLDLSAFPAKQVARGEDAIPAEREDFVARLLSSLPTAKAVLFHGHLRLPSWQAHRRRIGARFLSIDDVEFARRLQTVEVWREERSSHFEYVEANGRLVLAMHALTASLTREYRAAIAGLLAQHCA